MDSTNKLKNKIQHRLTKHEKEFYYKNKSAVILNSILYDLNIKLKQELKIYDIKIQKTVFDCHGQFVVSKDKMLVIKIINQHTKEDKKL